MLTTTDNPYNPYINYDMWNRWDVEHGYNTASYLSRIASLMVGGDVDEETSYRLAMMSIIEEDLFGVHIIIQEPEEMDEE